MYIAYIIYYCIYFPLCAYILYFDSAKFSIKLFSLKYRRYRIQASWSPVWSFWSQWWFGVPWHLLVLVHCVLSSTKSMQPSTRRFWSTLCFHLLTRFMDFLISFSSRTLAPGCPLCQNHFQVVCWPRYHCAWLASQHAWLEPYMEFRGYFQQKDEKQPIQQSRRA